MSWLVSLFSCRTPNWDSYDPDVVNFLGNGRDLSALSRHEQRELGKKADLIVQKKGAIREEYREKFIPLLRGRVSLGADFAEFQDKVGYFERVLTLVKECEFAGTMSLPSFKADLGRLKEITRLEKSARDAEICKIADKLLNHVTFKQNLEEKFRDADKDRLNEIVEVYFCSCISGEMKSTNAIFDAIELIYTRLEQRSIRASEYEKLLHLDSVACPSSLSCMDELTRICRDELNFDLYLQKMKEINLYRKYQSEIGSTNYEAQKAVLDRIEALSKEAEDLMKEVSPLLKTEEKEPLKFDPSQDFYVFPLGNIVLKEEGKSKSEAKWAIVDVSDVKDPVKRKQIFLFLNPEFLKKSLESKVPYAPICFDYDLKQRPMLFEKKEGPVRIFYETPDAVIRSQEDRDYGEKTRLLRNKKTGMYRRAIVTSDNREKNHPEVVIHKGTKEERTAQIDRAQAIWTSRILVKEILAGNSHRIDSKTLQHFIEYFDGVRGNDVAGKYDEPCFWDALINFGKLKEPLFKNIQERTSLQIVEAHQLKGKRKMDLNEGLKRIFEIVSTYRKWIVEMDRFLNGLNDYPEIKMIFTWFIPNLVAAKNELISFVEKMPSQRDVEQCKSDEERLEKIRQIIQGFDADVRYFDRLKLAFYKLGVAEKSGLVTTQRNRLFDQRLIIEAKKLIESPLEQIRKKYLEKYGTPDLKILNEISSFIKEEFKKSFPSLSPDDGTLYALASQIENDCKLKFGERYADAAVRSLQQLNEMRKSAGQNGPLFSNVFQTASRAEMCFEALSEAVSSLSKICLEAQKIYGSVKQTVQQIEKIRSEASKLSLIQMDDKGALKSYFPAVNA